MLSAALSWFDRQRPAPKHADERTLPADAFTPPDAGAVEAGRFDAPGRLHDAQVETLAAHMPRAQAEAIVAADERRSVTVALDNGEATFTPTGPALHPTANPARVAGGYADGGPVPAREPVVAGQLDRDLAATKRQADWPEPPDYGRPPTSVGQITVAMDQEIAGSLATARGESLALERRLRRAAEDRYAVAEAGRVRALSRVAELELVVKKLAKDADTATGEESGNSDD